VPAKELPVYTSLIDVELPNDMKLSPAAALYNNSCSGCHGKDRAGNHDGSIPSLLQKEKKLSAAGILKILQNGKGMMPSFSHLSLTQRNGITGFLLNDKTSSTPFQGSSKKLLPYRHTGYNRWYDSNGYPVSDPPWGTLTAINLNNGKQLWQVPLGEYKALIDRGYPPTGTDNYGGPLVTASGLLFIAASRDEMFRAFDKTNGKILWQAKLPAAGYASPSTYSVNGKQYIVIACGGGKLKTKSGDKYVAFALGD
jgi:quinoprotein glucose dehydrogenase